MIHKSQKGLVHHLRKNVAYAYHGQHRQNFWMMRCGECAKKFKINTKAVDSARERLKVTMSCPGCDHTITPENTTLLLGAPYGNDNVLYHNASTTVFDDKEEGAVKISFLMVERYRISGTPHPIIGKEAFRFMVRYNLERRTATAYCRELTGRNYVREGAVENVIPTWKHFAPYRNASLAGVNAFPQMDITLPRSVVLQFFEAVGVTPSGEDELVSWEELQWVNKLRQPLRIARREQFYYHLASMEEKRARMELVCETKSLAFRQEELASFGLQLDEEKTLALMEEKPSQTEKNTEIEMRAISEELYVYDIATGLRQKDWSPYAERDEEAPCTRESVAEAIHVTARCLKAKAQSYKDWRETAKKPAKWQRILRKGIERRTEKQCLEMFEELCQAAGTTPGQIPEKVQKAVFQQPWTIEAALYGSKLFGNVDILRGHIQKMGRFQTEAIPSRRRVDVHQIRRTSSRKPGHYAMYREMLLDIFGGEKHLEGKLKAWFDWNYLHDTADTIFKIRQAGIPFKTKGALWTLHGKASRLYRKSTLTHVRFLNVLDRKTHDFGNGKHALRFEYAKESKDLYWLGDAMDICVASYWNWCAHGNTQIVCVTKNEKPVACLELRANTTQKERWLTQAKSHHNKRISQTVQVKIAEFCMQESILIHTGDISEKWRSKVNEAVEKQEPKEQESPFQILPRYVNRRNHRPAPPMIDQEWVDLDDGADLPF